MLQILVMLTNIITLSTYEPNLSCCRVGSMKDFCSICNAANLSSGQRPHFSPNSIPLNTNNTNIICLFRGHASMSDQQPLSIMPHWWFFWSCPYFFILHCRTPFSTLQEIIRSQRSLDCDISFVIFLFHKQLSVRGEVTTCIVQI